MQLHRFVVSLAGILSIASLGCVVTTVPAQPTAPPATPAAATPAAPAPATPARVTPATPPKVAPKRPVVKAIKKGWVPLGKRNVTFRVDRDVIKVGARDGRFRAIRLVVKGSPLEMFKVRVVFGNDQKFEPKVRHVFKQGTWTRRIDLPGNKRIIKRVVFHYRSLKRNNGRATVRLFGQR